MESKYLIWAERFAYFLFGLFFLYVCIYLFQKNEMWPFLVYHLQNAHQHFSINRLPLAEVFRPTVFCLLFGLAIQLFFNRANTLLRGIVGLFIIFLGFRYMAWRLFATLNLDNVLEGIFSVLIFVAEIAMMIDALTASCIQNVPETNLTPEADILSQDVISGRFVPSVDVLVPTYNESVEILRRTIIGCQAMDYPNKKIYILDDTRRPAMRQLAEELGCYYLDRPDNSHAKAGNINNALKYVNSDYILFFDADFVPTTNFLHRVMGFFQDPKVALLQTPQHFYTPDPIECNLGLEGKLTNEQELFFRHIQPSRDAVNAIICCGTCYVIRRSALNEIGGIPTESITEDFFTSVRLQIAGYRLRYLNEVLSAGEAAGSIGAYIDQRLRWGQGIIQCLFCKHNPFTIQGLNLIQRFYFSSSVTYWIFQIFRVVLMLAPLGYLLFHLNPLKATIEGIFFYFLPYYSANLILTTWFNGGRRSPVWSNIYETILSFPMALTVIRALFNPFGKGFKVTPKGVEAKTLEINWLVMRPLVILVGLYMIGFAIRAFNLPLENNREPVFVNLAWASYNIMLFWVAILCAMDVPKKKFISFHHELDYELEVNGKVYHGTTCRISERDFLLNFDQPQQRFLMGTKATVSLPELQLRNLKVKIADLKENPDPEAHQAHKMYLEIEKISLTDERKLVEFLFCRPGQWEEQQIHETNFFFSFIGSIFRMNPLANG